MSDEMKTYQIHQDIKAKNFEDALEELKYRIERNPKGVLKEIDKDKYKIHVVNK